MKINHKEQAKRRASKKTPGRLSVADVLIVLLVIVSIAGLVARWVFDTVETEKTYIGESYRVSYKVEETYREILDGLSLRDRVFIPENDAYVGYLEVKPQVISTLGHSDRATAGGTMICDGQMVDGSLILNQSGISLTPGTRIELRTERARLTVVITEIERKS